MHFSKPEDGNKKQKAQPMSALFVLRRTLNVLRPIALCVSG
jgi:hypothetical protein